MQISTNYTTLNYREFEIRFSLTEQVSGEWRADVLVYLQGMQIGNFKIKKAFPTKVFAEDAAFKEGVKWAEEWRSAFEEKHSQNGFALFVWGALYLFESAEAAAIAVKWMEDTNANHEQFHARYAALQIPLSASKFRI